MPLNGMKEKKRTIHWASCTRESFTTQKKSMAELRRMHLQIPSPKAMKSLSLNHRRKKGLSSLSFNKSATGTIHQKAKNFGDKIVWFQNGSNKVAIELHVVQFGLKSYAWFQNRTSAQREFDLKPLSSITIINNKRLHNTTWNNSSASNLHGQSGQKWTNKCRNWTERATKIETKAQQKKATN